MGIRQGDIHSRETHASTAERNPAVTHYGMSSSSQTQPAAQGLIARLLRALFK
jgi:hypothetical protein